MDIDWSSAPEGATHWERGCRGESAGWMRKDGEDWFWLSSGGCWIKYLINYIPAERLQNMVPRPDSSPAWTGEGLPPVGTVCECQNDELKWLEGTIVHVGYHGSTKLAVMQAKEEILYGEVGEFRPIKTKEQIAAEERDKAIEYMVALVAKGQDYSVQTETGTSTADYVRDACKQLHDAGYRKQENNDAKD